MSTDRGHRLEPHTADVRVRAWAPTREHCIAEAVAAMVESFARIPPGVPTERAEFDVPAGPPDEMLIAVLDEVIYTIDTSGRIPSSADVTAHVGGGLRVRFELAGPDGVEVVGPAPKGVTLHDLQFAEDERGWSCRVILDV